VGRGFNGGWRKIMGPDARNMVYPDNNNRNWDASDLIYLPDAYYGDPAFTWLITVAPTSILFLHSARFPTDLRGDLLVGDIWGTISRFRMNTTRTGFVLPGGLADMVADNSSERNTLVWSDGWGVITDFKIGHDGYLYVCTYEGTSSTPAGIRRARPVNPPEIIQGRVKLSERNGLPLGVSLTIELYGEDIVQYLATTLDAYGRFSEQVSAPGTYTVKAKAGSYLSVSVPHVTIAPQGFAYREFLFTVNGDVNGDNVIDDADLLSVLFAFGSSESTADLNNDGVVDDADLLTVLFNFGSAGE